MPTAAVACREDSSSASRLKEPVMSNSSCVRLALSLLVFVVGAGGTGGKPADQQPPEVEVAQPISREVSDYQDLGGRTEPSTTVKIRARVSGYLDKGPFKD